MSEREVMLSGKPYQPWAQELQDDRDRARELIERYNASRSSDKAQRAGIIASLFGKVDKEHPPHLESPFYCDYVSVASAINLLTKRFLSASCQFSPQLQPRSLDSGIQLVCRQGLLLQLCLCFAGWRQDHHRRQSAVWTERACVHAHTSLGPCRKKWSSGT